MPIGAVYAIKKTFGSLFGNWLAAIRTNANVSCCHERRRNMMEYLLMNRSLYLFFSLYCVSRTFYFLCPFTRARRSFLTGIQVYCTQFGFFRLRVFSCILTSLCVCVSVSSRTIMINCSKTRLHLLFSSSILLELQRATVNELMKWNAAGQIIKKRKRKKRNDEVWHTHVSRTIYVCWLAFLAAFHIQCFIS